MQAQIQTQYYLKPGYLYVTSEPTLIQTVLGSSVSVCIWDARHNLAGINHFAYPRIDDLQKATVLYGNVAMFTLLKTMISKGSQIQDMEAQIWGGAHLDNNGKTDTGTENVREARMCLEKQNIRIVSEDVGGTRGRKIVFDTVTGHVAVLKVRQLRKTDWY